MRLKSVVQLLSISMNEDKIKAVLEKLGLSEFEINCYIQLLKRSPQKARDFSKRFAVPKSTVLFTLNRLADEFGVIKRIHKKNTYYFSVEDVNDLLIMLSRREEQVRLQKVELTDLLPMLRSMQHFELNKPKIYYFEGIKGIHKALEQVLEETDEYVGYGTVDDDIKYLPKVYPDYYERRVNKKIIVKAILPALPLSIKDTIENELKRQRRTRLVPTSFYRPIQLNVYHGTTVFYSYEENFALMIKSKPIADCLLMLFDMAFEGKAKEYDEKIRAEILQQET